MAIAMKIIQISGANKPGGILHIRMVLWKVPFRKFIFRQSGDKISHKIIEDKELKKIPI